MNRAQEVLNLMNTFTIEVEDLTDEEFCDFIEQGKLWSTPVTKGAKWSPPPGLFVKKASDVVAALKAASKDLKQSMSRLNFYINRAGKNLSPERRKELEKAKGLLAKAYT